MTKMTQQDRQKATRTARMTEGIQQKIPDDLVILAEKTKYRIDKNFGEFMRKRGKSNIAMVREMYPIIRDATHVSKMLNGTVHVSLEILVALHYLYGIDLNEFIAGDKAERPSLTPGQVETLRGIVQMYDDSSEKTSRNLQK